MKLLKKRCCLSTINNPSGNYDAGNKKKEKLGHDCQKIASQTMTSHNNLLRFPLC